MLNQICQPLSAINSIAIGGFFCWQIPQNEGYFYTSLRWTVSRREKVLTKIALLIFNLLFTVCRGFSHGQKLIIDFMSMSHIALMSVILIISENLRKRFQHLWSHGMTLSVLINATFRKNNSKNRNSIHNFSSEADSVSLI